MFRKVSFIVAVLFSMHGYAQHFTDVAISAGIDHNFHFGDYHFGGGVAVFDYNQDGYSDMYLTGGSNPDKLFKNNGDGTFTDVTVNAGFSNTANFITQSVTAGDIDNDGYRDLYITTRCLINDYSQYSHNLMYLNNGDGTFTDITSSANLLPDTAFSTVAAFGDVNLDGFLDIYVGNWVHTSVLNHFDSIGNMIVPIVNGSPNYLYINNGDNTFSELGLSYTCQGDSGLPWGVVFTDYDQDGDPDVYLANDFGNVITPNTLLRNDYPTPGFTDVSAISNTDVTIAGMGLAVGDVNEDGWMDFYSTNESLDRLLLNNGNGTFSNGNGPFAVGNDHWYFNGDSVSSIGWGANFLDFDNDSYLDLYVVNGQLLPHLPIGIILDTLYNPNVLYRNVNGVTFDDVSSVSGADDILRGRGSALLDYDHDGDLDMFMVNQENPPGYGFGTNPKSRLYRNNTSSNNWVEVKLNGRTNNRDAIGARVRVVFGNRSLLREIEGGSSHMSQNTLVAHFGLGATVTLIDTVEVTWPGGDQQILINQNVNQLITITEDVPNACAIQLTHTDSSLVFPTVHAGIPYSPGYTDSVGQNSQFSFPHQMIVDAPGNLLVADESNHVIRKLDPNGNVTTLAGTTQGFQDGNLSVAQFNKPMDFCYDSKGNLYVADADNYRIRMIDSAGTVSTYAGSGIQGNVDGIGGAATFMGPVAIAIDAFDNLLVLDIDPGNSARIRKINTDAEVFTVAGQSGIGFVDGAGVSAKFNDPTDIVVSPNGYIYVADNGNTAIREMDYTWRVTTLAGGTPGFQDGMGSNARFSAPRSIGIDQQANLWVADGGLNQRIRKVTTAGAVTTLETNGEVIGVQGLHQYDKLYGIVVDKNNNVYVSDSASSVVRKMIPGLFVCENDQSVVNTDLVCAYPATSYEWSNNGNVISTMSSLSVPTTSTGIYQVDIEYDNGCEVANQIAVVVNATMVEVSNDTAICDGDTIQLSSNGADTYVWTPSSALSNGSIANPMAFPMGATDFILTATDSLSCVHQDTVSVDVNQLPLVDFATVDPLCVNDPLYTLVEGTPNGGTYNGAGITNGQFDPNNAGVGVHVASYTYQDGVTGCTNTASQSIEVKDLPAVSVQDLDEICYQDPAFTLTIGQPANGVYSGPGVNGSEFDPAVAGVGSHTITYAYTDNFDCTAEATGTIHVEICSGVSEIEGGGQFDIYPNPNNGEFNIKVVSDREIQGLRVLDVYGRTVLKMDADRKSNEWSPKVQLDDAAQGVYYIQIDLGNQKLTRMVVVK